MVFNVKKLFNDCGLDALVKGQKEAMRAERAAEFADLGHR
jgi:hypothetical protein